jgi:hypothetical protein
VSEFTPEQIRHMALDFSLRTHTLGGNAEADVVLATARKYFDFLAGKTGSESAPEFTGVSG